MKIVGKLIIAWLLIVSASACATITLQVISTDDEPLQQVGAGEPFIITAIVTDEDLSGQKLLLAGLDNFFVQHSGVQIRTVNGRSTKKYIYNVRIDTPGTYALGPAELQVNGNVVRSDTITVTVAGKQLVSAKHAGQQNSKVFLRLAADKDRAVIGEKVRCSLRFFYVNDGASSLSTFGEPDISGCSLSNREGPFQGTQKINDIMYNYIEVCWDVHPAQLGQLSIPAYNADFIMRSERDYSLSRFASFFGSQQMLKRVYSNALTLQVDELPVHQGQVNAVGSLSAMHAEIRPSVVKEGEAMVLTLRVDGVGSFVQIDPLQLHAIPGEFKWYDSKQYSLDELGPHGEMTTCFEFVIQGMKAGDWEIPKQQFTYFDVQSRTYKTLQSELLMVTVLPSAVNKATVNPVQVNEQHCDEQDSVCTVRDEIRPLHKEAAWYFVQQREIPLQWFLFLCFVPFGIAVLQLLNKSRKRYYKRNQLHYKKKKAFSYARAQLNYAKQHNNYAALYPLFVELCASRAQVSMSEVSQDFIEHMMHQAQVPQDVFNEWQFFFMTIAGYVFSDASHNVTLDTDIFQHAEKWLTRLEKWL